MKRTTNKWLEHSTYKVDSPLWRYYKHDLEEIYKRLIDTKSTYCVIMDDEVDFYIEEEETDEEYENRLKRETEAKELVEKVEFERAKETYLKLKNKYE